MKRTSQSAAFTLIELLVVISIIAILAGIALPVFGEVKVKGDQTKALSNAKQIGTACKIFASDNNGLYPRNTDYPPGEAATPVEAVGADSSNKVLRTLIPDYLPDRSIFVLQKSAFFSASAVGTRADPLPAGANHWAYVSGLNDTSNSRWPLLADGFDPQTSTNPAYVTTEALPGGLWKGKKAIVIRCDGSGNVETLLTGQRTIKRSDDDKENALKGSTGTTADGKIPWFETGATTKIYVLNAAKP